MSPFHQAKHLQQQLKRETGKLGHKKKVSLMWKIRVGLGPPQVPLRTLTLFCQDFDLLPSQTISHELISRLRDAFAEVVKKQNKEELSVRARGADAIVISHVHDEATMRVKSRIAEEEAIRIKKKGRRKTISNIQITRSSHLTIVCHVLEIP